MNWLARLKDEKGQVGTLQNLQKSETGGNPEPTKPTKPTKETFVGFVGTPAGHIQKIVEAANAADEFTPAGELDRSGPAPVSSITSARVAVFADKGLNPDDSLVLALRLALRDQERDDRRVCLECAHLSGGGRNWSCSQWRKTGMKGPATPFDLVDILQRCAGFAVHLRINE